jgi:hypothetical protein
MLRRNAFLRALPRVIDLEERLTLDALLMASDLASAAYDGMIGAIREYEKALHGAVYPPTKMAVALNTWALIDQAHNFRQGSKKPIFRQVLEYQKFVRDFESVTKMRNGMDHLASNVGNSAKRKGVGHPIYGAISYPKASSDHVTITSIIFGSLQHDSFYGPILDMQKLGSIHFAAFGKQINISEMMCSLEMAINSINDSYERHVKPMIRNFAEKNGLDFDKLLSDCVPQINHARMSLSNEKSS